MVSCPISGPVFMSGADWNFPHMDPGSCDFRLPICAFFLTVGAVYFPCVCFPVYRCKATSDSLFPIGLAYAVGYFSFPFYSFWSGCNFNTPKQNSRTSGNSFWYSVLLLFCSVSFIGSFSLIISPVGVAVAHDHYLRIFF